MRFAYACQNLTLNSTTGRTLRLVNLGDAERVRSVITSNLSDLETIAFAIPTWKRTPKVHLSSQDPAKQRGAHAWDVAPEDFVALLHALSGYDAAVMVEAKGKEQAVLPFLAGRAMPAGAVHRGGETQ